MLIGNFLSPTLTLAILLYAADYEGEQSITLSYTKTVACVPVEMQMSKLWTSNLGAMQLAKVGPAGHLLEIWFCLC